MTVTESNTLSVKTAGLVRGIRHHLSRIGRPRRGLQATDPYVTHIPVLVALSRLKTPKRVLELGSGLYSSTTFLDRSIFPDLVELHSVENDPEWAKRTISVCGSDLRFTMTIASSTMAETVSQIPTSAYDLIFIDDSLTADARSATIREVVKRRHFHSLVVIHDFEQQAYRRAARGAKRCFVFDVFVPQVGILWEDDTITKRQLKELCSLLAGSASPGNAGDRGLWKQVVFQNHL